MHNYLLNLILSASLLCLPFIVEAGSFDNTLWLGNNKNASLGILNVTRTGKILVVCMTLKPQGLLLTQVKT